MGQENEIRTVRERTISLKLSDADIERLCEKAGTVDMTVEALLEGFIGDLVDGTSSHESNERGYIKEWFERTYGGIFAEGTFLKFLIECGGVEDLIEGLEERQYCIDMMASIEEELPPQKKWELIQRESMEQEQENLQYAEDTIRKYWSEFLDWTNETDPKIEEEIKKVIAWKDYMEHLKKM